MEVVCVFTFILCYFTVNAYVIYTLKNNTEQKKRGFSKKTRIHASPNV